MDLSKYYAEICKIPMLEKTEEVALFEEYRDQKTSAKRKEEIRSTVVNANLRFAFKQAKRLSKNDPDVFSELISAGNEGLIVGFDKYDSNRDIRYLSYAGWWVNQRILKEMSKMRLVALPIWKQQLAAKIVKIRDSNPGISIEDAKALLPGISEKDIIELWETKYLTYYIDDMDEGEFEIDTIGESVQRKIDDERVWKAVASLPSPHREILARTYGLEDGEEHTPAKMAKALKLPKEEVKKIKAEGLKMLKQILGKKEAYLDG